MCYDNIEEIGAAVEALKKAKEYQAEWATALTANTDEIEMVSLTKSEILALMQSRVESATAALNALVRPVTRVDGADRGAAVASMASRTGLPSQEGGA